MPASLLSDAVWDCCRLLLIPPINACHGGAAPVEPATVIDLNSDVLLRHMVQETRPCPAEKESRAIDFPPPVGAHKKVGDGGMPEAGQVIKLR